MLSGQYTLDEPEWDDVSADAKDLVVQLLKYSSDERISALDAMNHPWIQNNATIDRVNKEVASRTLQNLQNFRVSLSLNTQKTAVDQFSHLSTFIISLPSVALIQCQIHNELNSS